MNINKVINELVEQDTINLSKLKKNEILKLLGDE